MPLDDKTFSDILHALGDALEQLPPISSLDRKDSPTLVEEALEILKCLLDFVTTECDYTHEHGDMLLYIVVVSMNPHVLDVQQFDELVHGLPEEVLFLFEASSGDVAFFEEDHVLDMLELDQYGVCRPFVEAITQDFQSHDPRNALSFRDIDLHCLVRTLVDPLGRLDPHLDPGDSEKVFLAVFDCIRYVLHVAGSEGWVYHVSKTHWGVWLSVFFWVVLCRYVFGSVRGDLIHQCADIVGQFMEMCEEKRHDCFWTDFAGKALHNLDKIPKD